MNLLLENSKKNLNFDEFDNQKENIILHLLQNFKNNKNDVLFFYEYFSLNEHIILKQDYLRLKIKGIISHKKFYKENEDYFLKIEISCSISELMLNKLKLNEISEFYETNFPWSIEKQDKNYSNIMKSNIVELVTNEKYLKLKKILIDGKTPNFENKEILSYYSFNEIIENYSKIHLNNDQKQAIHKVS